MLKINPYPYLFALVALVALYTGHRGIVSYEVNKAVVVAQDKLTRKHQDLLLQASTDARKTETHLENNALALEKVKNDEITRLTGQRDLAVKRLSDRPARTSTPNTPKTITNQIPCIGSQLFREDAEFLTREAYRADEVVLERDYYYKQYENARKTINDYANSH